MAVGDVKRIVCLANSRMLSGRCIAGRELRAGGRPGPWVRPVSGREDEGVTEAEYRYADGGGPRLLDVVDVPVLGPRPAGHQRENWLLDPDRRWARADRLPLADIPRWADAVGSLWINGSSTSNGLNDRVPVSAANSLDTSLYLIKADLEVCVFNPRAAYGDFRRRVQGRFRYNRADYRMWVTDPEYEQKYLAGPNGSFELGARFLTVSLAGVPVYGYCYKIIAAIIEP